VKAGAASFPTIGFTKIFDISSPTALQASAFIGFQQRFARCEIGHPDFMAGRGQIPPRKARRRYAQAVSFAINWGIDRFRSDHRPFLTLSAGIVARLQRSNLSSFVHSTYLTRLLKLLAV